MDMEGKMERETFLPLDEDFGDSEIANNSEFQWMEATKGMSDEVFNVLDPDDPLMKRFQDALKAHLTRIHDKLSEEILNLEQDAKESKKKRESEAVELYANQEEVASQQERIDKYEKKLAEVSKSREDNTSQIEEMQELKKLLEVCVEKEIGEEKKCSQELESLLSMDRRFDEWEEEMANLTKVSLRMSEKDAKIQRELLKKKQYEDYILAKLMEEVTRLENEIRDCREQLTIKENEILEADQTITDANADLEGLQRTQKKLIDEWNRVIASVAKRDKLNEELCRERGKIRESFTTLSSQIEKIKKETDKEMESNERLTSIQLRLENDVRHNEGMIANDEKEIDLLENQLVDVTQLLEQTEKEFNISCLEYQQTIQEDKTIDKEIAKLLSSRAELEEIVLSKLENKVSHDKTIKALNKKLRECREKTREEELSLLQTENNYGKKILEMEKLKASMESEKFDVEDLMKINVEKEKKLDAMRNEINKCDGMIAKKQQKIVALNKKIEEVISSLPGGEERSPHDLRIAELEKAIEETEMKNRKSQDFWLRQEGYMVELTEQRGEQLREQNLLNKQITVMEQKYLKLETENEKRKKEEENISRNIEGLHKKLLLTNERLAAKREIHNELEDKNLIAKNECIETIRQDQLELVKLRNEIIQAKNDRQTLEEQLNSAQREALSWEKKVRLASETVKELKEERSAGGDLAVMKNEIHKMEMRLSHLKKTQEKMIRDMEFCVARRDVIIDKAMAREKRNPKGLHNQKVVFEKRQNDKRLKIKQMNKESKQLEAQIADIKEQQKTLLRELDENQKTMRACEDEIPDIDKQIDEAELIKCHKLECLVRKQRKIRLLQDVKGGRYKMVFKSEMALNDEFEKQRTLNANLKEILEETYRDFPLLQGDIRKILLGLETT